MRATQVEGISPFPSWGHPPTQVQSPTLGSLCWPCPSLPVIEWGKQEPLWGQEATGSAHTEGARADLPPPLSQHPPVLHSSPQPTQPEQAETLLW